MPWLVAAILIAMSAPACAVTLGPAFGDHMVLQRDTPLNVFGSGAAGESIEATIGDQTRRTTAGDDGQWRLSFDPMPATRAAIPFRVCGADTIELRDVLVGEVWLSAGQSNMAFALSRASTGKAALTEADRPMLRLMRFAGAADGGSGSYTAAQIERLTVDRFCEGSWQHCTPTTAAGFSAVAYSFGVELLESLDVPVGIIDVSIGGTPTEAWMSREALAADPKLRPLVAGNWLNNPHTGAWCRQRGESNLRRATDAGEAIPGDDLGPNHSFKPTFCWRAVVAPLVPTTIRGVVWYQGESNADSPSRVAQHNRLLPLLIGDWRAKWRRPDLPFGVVQLPAMNRPDWPEFRDGQRRVCGRLEHVGMAVTLDLGDADDVHPTHKQPVGDRLARWALAEVYGRRVAHSGPLYRSVTRKRGRLVLCFTHDEGLRAAEGALLGFEIAGADGRFVPAEAHVVGRSVVVSSTTVPDPVNARYGWSPVPDPMPNLTNQSGLPASPFTTRTAGVPE